MSDKYMPIKIRYLLICESPPLDCSHYFYCEEDRGNQILFATIIKAFYDYDYKNSLGNKKALLNRLKEDGVFLIDAVDYPINRDVKGGKVNLKNKKMEIKNNKKNLFDRLCNMKRQKVLNGDTKIILISKTVHSCLYEELITRGLNVINDNPIKFPFYYRDRNTVDCLRYVLK
ncbi:MAG: hypothetical protein QXV73_05810 [Candidatus Micrarchaeia archaeon]